MTSANPLDSLRLNARFSVARHGRSDRFPAAVRAGAKTLLFGRLARCVREMARPYRQNKSKIYKARSVELSAPIPILERVRGLHNQVQRPDKRCDERRHCEVVDKASTVSNCLMRSRRLCAVRLN